MQLIVIIGIYFVGYLLSYWMLYTDHRADGKVFTNGDQVLSFLISFLSWFAILLILIASWIGKINRSGYWSKPVKPVENKPEA